MKLGSRDELKRPNACVLILLMLIPVLALVTVADNVAVAACTCPYGGVYRSSIYTKLCGWQYNVCVSFDYNCANDYHAVCGTTQTSTPHATLTQSRTTRTTSATTVQTTPPNAYSNACPYGGQYFSSIYTSVCGWQYDVCVSFDYNCANDYPAVHGTTQTRSTSTRSITTRATATIRTGTACGYIEIMMGQCSQGSSSQTTTGTARTTQGAVMFTAPYRPLYTVVLIVKSQGTLAGWRVYVDGNYVGLTDSEGTLKMTVAGGSHQVEIETSFMSGGGLPYTYATSQFYVSYDGQVVTVTFVSFYTIG
jgi:hypothetical protein